MPVLPQSARANETARLVEPMQGLPVAKLLDQNYATEADVWLEMNGDSLRLKDSKPASVTISRENQAKISSFHEVRFFPAASGRSPSRSPFQKPDDQPNVTRLNRGSQPPSLLAAFSNRISRLFSHDATTSNAIAAIFLHTAYLCGGIGIASQFSIC